MAICKYLDQTVLLQLQLVNKFNKVSKQIGCIFAHPFISLAKEHVRKLSVTWG